MSFIPKVNTYGKQTPHTGVPIEKVCFRSEIKKPNIIMRDTERKD